MSDRYPLIVNPENNRIEELPSGDNLNLTNSGIVGATTITAERFIGFFQGTALEAESLTTAESILTGTISTERLNGFYNIGVGTATNLSDAANILTGTISSQRLSGGYDINISGIAKTATNLDDAANINTGIINAERLTGVYNIDITGSAFESVGFASALTVSNEQLDKSYYILYSPEFNVQNATISADPSGLSYNPFLNRVGIATTSPRQTLDVNGIVTATSYLGSGAGLVGIVTQINAGIGINLTSTQTVGKGVVNIDSYFPIGKTIFVTQNGDDDNTGLTENDSKRTIKAASAIAFPGDTIKVFPGVYIEENPIYLTRRVAVEGTELRNCIVTPKYTDRDLFYVNNSCHLTDLSFIGPEMTNGAAVVALQPLTGVATDRFFDAARMIRYNLDFIAAETVGYLTSTNYKIPAFVVPTGNPTDCKDDIKDIMKAVIHDITRGGNSKCVGAGKSYYTEAGALQHITGTDVNGYSVRTATIDALIYAAGIARSCINNVTWTGNYQNQFTQVKDLTMQDDPATGSNSDIGSCANVVSAIYSCVGVVTTIVGNGLSVLGVGIRTSFPANSGIGTTAIIGITNAVYDNTSGQTTLRAPGLSVKKGDIVEIRDLLFTCNSGGSIGTQRYPSGAYGYEFDVTKINGDGSFIVNTGISTIAHTYVGGGYVVNRAIGVSTASYDNVTGLTTITAPGAKIKIGDFVKLQNLRFSCLSGAGTTTLYPTGNLGYEFRVINVDSSGSTFVVNTGVSTIAHTYVSGGVILPPYSPGVGPITQGPYIRNCTNFIGGSIGMKVDGFNAEPGDKNDIGVTGTMSVDSYTQYNQGGIGVSITNGGYAQLVSIFTICDDIAIYTGSGGQCDLTNSNSSFGNYGLVANGVGDENSKSIYRYTGTVVDTTAARGSTVKISGVGTNRPYDGQAVYFGNLYYFVDSISVTNGGSGYTNPPRVSVTAPEGERGITVQATATIENGSVTAINIVNSGSQYINPPTITIEGPIGAGTTATASVSRMQPIYYKVDSATLPSAGISTVTLVQTLNNTVSAGTTAYFSRQSLQIATTISFEYVGAGTNIDRAKPALGGVTIQENEVVQDDGGLIVYTSTDQGGNFKIGDGVTVNQATGSITGRDFVKSLFTTMTPFILALSE